MPNSDQRKSPQAMCLVDFGSTFTKAAVVDLNDGGLLASAQSRTTVDTDVLDGMSAVLKACEDAWPGAGAIARRCSSSAGGGLRMVVLGLEADITTQAARQVALNAGGRIAATFSGPLQTDEVTALAHVDPDLILLAGGTDGGDSECLVLNAQTLSRVDIRAAIIVAGNVESQHEAGAHLERAGRTWASAPNVLPEIGVVAAEPAQLAIRDIFIQHVIGGKELSRSTDFADMISLPTPDAVRQGVELLSMGTPEDPGLGELLVVDVGGATTDVYSVLNPKAGGSHRRELVPTPKTSRTVEADLGLRWSAEGVVQAAAELGLIDAHDLATLTAAAERRSADPSFLPDSPQESECDITLARLAVVIAVQRHAGIQRVGIGPDGVSVKVQGRDLREVPRVIATGGIFRAYPDVDFSALINDGFARFDRRVLVPDHVDVTVDNRYVLAAAGLLSSSYPGAALRLMLSNLTEQPNEGALS